jgi:hypothetical protein
MAKLSSRTRKRLKIAISLTLIAVLVYFLDFASLAAALRDIEVTYVVLAFLMVIGNRVLMPLKWNLLLRARNIHLSHFNAIRIYTIASFLGLVLPPTVGADSVRGYYLRQAGIRLTDAVASIVIERVFGLIVLLVFTVAGFFLLVDLLREGEMQTGTFAVILGVVSAAVLAALYLSFTPWLHTLARSAAVRLEGTRLKSLGHGAESFVAAYQEYRHRELALALFCGLTAMELTIVIVRSYVIALALGVELDVLVFFAFLPLVTLLNRMPVSFDGFGINEALFIWFLALFGVAHEQGFLIGLINHLLFIAGVLPGGLFYVFSDRGRDLPPPGERRPESVR